MRWACDMVNDDGEGMRWLCDFAPVVECVGCGTSVPEPVACWNMADPVCPECWRATFAEGVAL